MLCYDVCAHAASPRHRSLAMGRMRHTPSRPVRPSELLFYTLCILYQYAALALLPVALERVCCTHAKSGRGSSRRVLYGRVLSLCRRVRMEMAATHNTYLREYLERVSAYRGLQGGWLVGWLVGRGGTSGGREGGIEFGGAVVVEPSTLPHGQHTMWLSPGHRERWEDPGPYQLSHTTHTPPPYSDFSILMISEMPSYISLTAWNSVSPMRRLLEMS